MGIYDKNGDELFLCYDKNGNPLEVAYDKNGDPIWYRGPVTLRVMSFNIRWGSYSNAIRRITDAIYTEEHPDIIGFQEVIRGSDTAWPTVQSGGGSYPTYLANNFGVPYSAHGTEAYNKTAIASKYAISDFESVRYSIQDSEPEWREYTKCHITVRGKTILWYNTHLGLGPEYRAVMRDELLADIEEAMETEDYIIVTGDFNVQVASDETTDSEFYAEQVQPFIDIGLTLANWQDFGMIPTYTNTTGSGTWKCLDNIMVNANITIDEAWADMVKVTDNQENQTIDHVPFVADLILRDVT